MLMNAVEILAFTMALVPIPMDHTNASVPQLRQERNVNWKKQRVLAIRAMEATFAPCLNGHLADSNV